MHYNTVNRLLKELMVAEHAVRQVQDTASEQEERELLLAVVQVLASLEVCRDAVRKINYTSRKNDG